MIFCKCPHCGELMGLLEKYNGQYIECPFCDEMFLVSREAKRQSDEIGRNRKWNLLVAVVVALLTFVLFLASGALGWFLRGAK